MQNKIKYLFTPFFQSNFDLPCDDRKQCGLSDWNSLQVQSANLDLDGGYLVSLSNGWLFPSSPTKKTKPNGTKVTPSAC